jgi:RNA polymerase sigma-70 factor (ECF subfamily)
LPTLPRYEFDGAYIQRLIAEDPETERHFSTYFGDLLTVKLRSRLRTASLVDDAKQETFVRVLAALKEKGGLNVLFELYRAGRRVTPLEEGTDLPDERRPDVECSIVAGQERLRVRRALAALPRKEQELLRWLFFEERDKDRICRELNVDRNYLRVLLHRAKARFRQALTAAGDDRRAADVVEHETR